MEKDPRIYVRHILDAIANIETDTAGYNFERFRADRRGATRSEALAARALIQVWTAGPSTPEKPAGSRANDIVWTN